MNWKAFIETFFAYDDTSFGFGEDMIIQWNGQAGVGYFSGQNDTEHELHLNLRWISDSEVVTSFIVSAYGDVAIKIRPVQVLPRLFIKRLNEALEEGLK